MKKQYTNPEVFKPTLEDEKRVAAELAKLFSSKVAVKLSDGSHVQGEADKLKITK
ncbi:MAG: hypothetical protein HC831_01720 [Chloroflexia bacterium]|nr:hypothetical protein [Chloroflexia bacterium]